MIAIYDLPMCCSSGLCGPTLDPALVKMNAAVQALENRRLKRRGSISRSRSKR